MLAKLFSKSTIHIPNLQDYTNKSYEELTLDDLVAITARVSSGKSPKELTEEVDKIIRYMLKNGHWSPFEMVNVCIEIHTTRMISSQLNRHTSFRLQEFSQRYSEVEGYELSTFTTQSESNHQGGLEEHPYNEWLTKQATYYLDALYNLYQEALDAGISRESARQILPMCSKTKCYYSNSLRGWLHVIKARKDSHAQREARDLARSCESLLESIAPITILEARNLNII